MNRNRNENDLFAFLIGNMKQMEVELRAQSIVFEALATKSIHVEQIADSLTMARNSTEMQKLVGDKYRLLAKHQSALRSSRRVTLCPVDSEEHNLLN